MSDKEQTIKTVLVVSIIFVVFVLAAGGWLLWYLWPRVVPQQDRDLEAQFEVDNSFEAQMERQADAEHRAKDIELHDLRPVEAKTVV